ncbi:integrins alpha chain [Rippkaea orientalis PCC 8801]|uniref:Integrins alpha chain n=1 Tax=Rippkaea orientalis (strain PCC 8801 / RF-1) TaxID=41431 RepID=B7K374_RIPO1|nr:CRTAC1 family protein [Rippkaea orientalis]ACK64394.1 integrins alpha chain [Rippkaea orientalis PCC 8801]
MKLNLLLQSSCRNKFLILFLTILLLIIPLQYHYSQDITSKWFISKPIVFNAYNLFDVGVTDINNDNNLDIFTTNHNSLNNLMIGDGKGNFTDVVSQWKFDHIAEFPGFADSEKEPKFETPGLYVFWQKRTLIIKNYKMNNPQQLDGEIKILSEVKIENDSLSKVSFTQNQLSNSEVKTQINFELAKDSWLTITPKDPMQTSLQLNENIPLKNVYVGLQKVNPKTHNLDLKILRDRHSISWADYNSDGNIDAFITRSGGSLSSKERFRKIFQRHLLSNRGNFFEDVTEKSGIVETACRAVTAAWVDFDNNNSLELYVVCIDGTSRLYQKNNNGKFVDIAVKVGLSPSQTTPDQAGWNKNGLFVWLDTDADGDVDLLRSYQNSLKLYVNELGLFKEKTITPHSPLIDIFSSKFSVTDYDLDGDLDILFVSGYGSILLKNLDGEYALTNPSNIGLPDNPLIANWVDYDNDGFPDVHMIPGGIYHQLPNHNFTKAHILDREFIGLSFPLDPQCIWFDFDNSGTQDVLMTSLPYHHWKSVFWNFSVSPNMSFINGWLQRNLHPHSEFKNLREDRLKTADHTKSDFVWQGKLYGNINSQNHWLQIKLIGLPKNPQAIGAKVIMVTDHGQLLQQVGAMENSRYSQGYSPLHFGLGKNKRPKLIKIFWNDGKFQEIQQPEGDKLLIIKRESNL